MKMQVMTKYFFMFFIFLVIALCAPETSYSQDSGVAEPRTVRLIYFLPTDSQFEPDMPEKIREEVRKAQAFYADQMEAHGYGKRTFRVETNEQGEMIVHRLNGKHAFDHYRHLGTLLTESGSFDSKKIDCIISGTDRLPFRSDPFTLGVGGRVGKNSGFAVVLKGFNWQVLAHELGHAFGLGHDFRNRNNLMAHANQSPVLSACSAMWLSMHSSFNPEIPLEEGEPPAVELLSSPRYPEGAESFPVQLRVSDPKGVSQVHLSLQNNLIACRELGGEIDAVVEFDYKGVYLDSSVRFTRVVDHHVHRLEVIVINTAGDLNYSHFSHAQSSPYYMDTLRGHNSRLVSVSFSPDSTILASVAKDGPVHLWDVQSRTIFRTFSGETLGGQVSSMLFSPTDPLLASVTSDKKIKLLDIKTGGIIHTLSGHRIGAASLAFSPDGRTLASGGFDPTIKLWDVETGENFATLLGDRRGNPALAFSPDGKSLASATYFGNIMLWDIESREMRKQISAHNGFIFTVSYSPDGKLLASGGSDWKAKLWDAETGKHIRTFEGHIGLVSSVSFLVSGKHKLLVSGAHDATVKLWEVDSGANIETFPSAALQVTSVSLSSDQTILAAGTTGNFIELWSITNFKQVYLERNTEVNIPDPSLRKAVAAALGRSPDDPVVKGDIQGLSQLKAQSASISDLTGLELAINLTHLQIDNNAITDITALTGLTKLANLQLDNNTISDISALTGLTNLTQLSLHNNAISDISALAGLTKLRNLDLTGNLISDLSPLIENAGSGEKYTLRVRDNPLSYDSVHTHIPLLQERGITVDYNRSTHPAVLKVSGDNQEGDAGMPLDHPFVVEVQDEKGVLSAGVSVTFAVTEGGGTLSATTVTTDADGRAETTLTLGTTPGKNTVQATATEITQSVLIFNAIATEGEPVSLKTDVNGDGVVNIIDLTLVATNFGATGSNAADVNGDGVVNIIDLTLVAAAFGNTAAAPIVWDHNSEIAPTRADVEAWLKEARQLNLSDPNFQRGIVVLESLLKALTPKMTALLPNYPNPFNPETWIPYQLAIPSDVSISIYASDGKLIRKLDLGHQPIGTYHHRSNAAHWDGKNAQGELVASGVYFYTFTAGEFSATRKMLIRK